MRTKGKIKSWNDDKGYGFIAPLAGGKELFVHISAFGNRNRRPELNEIVTYSISRDRQGRPCAANATLAGDKLVKKAPRKARTTAIWFALLFLAGVGIVTLAGYLPVIVSLTYLVLSLVTFVAYAVDKSAAQNRAWRTKEGTLLTLGLVGGWPGALIAQETLRHKSKKTSFRASFWFTVLLNCAVLAWLFTEDGQFALQGLLA